jgi:hypothetical protein
MLMPENSNRPRRARRFLTGAAVLSIAAAGAAWSGCGESDEEQAVEDAQEQINEQLDEASQQFEEETGQSADEAQDALDQAFEDAPKP